MTHQANQWATSHELYAQDGTYRSLPTTAASLSMLLNHTTHLLTRNNTTPSRSPHYLSCAGTTSQKFTTLVLFGDIPLSVDLVADTLIRTGPSSIAAATSSTPFIASSISGPALGSLACTASRGGYTRERSLPRGASTSGTRRIFRVLGIVNPLFNENELDWDTFDLHTTETVHEHKDWHEAEDWDHYDEEDGARSTCSALLYRSTQAQRRPGAGPCRRQTFCY